MHDSIVEHMVQVHRSNCVPPMYIEQTLTGPPIWNDGGSNLEGSRKEILRDRQVCHE